MELARDEFGAVTHDPDRDVLELEWFDATAAMTDDDFKRSLEQLAGFAEQHQTPNVLIDVTRFAHRPGEGFGAWRDENIIPRYNAAGVKKFAFLVPPGAPGTVENGHLPEPEGPATFPTGYFERRDGIDSWFSAPAAP